MTIDPKLTVTFSGSSRTTGVLKYGTNVLGEIEVEVDGFYVYYPEHRGGAWTAHLMRSIADLLDKLNEPWQKNIDEYFEQQERLGEDLERD